MPSFIERLKRDDTGLAMVMVIGLAGVLAVFTTTIAVTVITSQRQVSGERQNERALHISDSGVDHSLYLLTEDRDFNTGEAVDPDAFASHAAERAWAVERALTVASSEASNPNSQRMRTQAEGQWVTIKPPDRNILYSVGFVPSYSAYLNGAPQSKARVVRAAYDFAPFAPETAILTGGDLDIHGHVTVSGGAGSAHTNGNGAIWGASGLEGFYSAGGSCTGCTNPGYVGDPENSGPNRPERDIPNINARDLYHLSEYDLCPNGEVRAGPNYSGPEKSTSSTPCEGGLLGTNSYRSWSKSGSEWRQSGNTAYDGVYYIYQGNATISGSPGSTANPWKVTVIAEATGNSCTMTNGDILVSGSPRMQRSDKGQPFLLVADRDIRITGNFDAAGSSPQAVIAAGEQFEIAGNPSFNGMIVTEESCSSPGSPVHTNSVHGNPTINYDGTLEIPMGSTIRTTHWIEL